MIWLLLPFDRIVGGGVVVGGFSWKRRFSAIGGGTGRMRGTIIWSHGHC
jgi:hypothetical protein